VGDPFASVSAAIKNVGENTAKAIVNRGRPERIPNRFYDFCERIESRFLNKRVFEQTGGPWTSLGPRESMLASVDDAVAACSVLPGRANPASTIVWNCRRSSADAL